MINLSELRVGNTVNKTNLMFNDGYYPVTVESISDYGINVSSSYEGSLDWDGEENIEGIPLTDEILLTNGFENEKGIFQHSKLNFFLTPGLELWVGQWNEVDNQHPVKIIKFLHQLQNIVFELFDQYIDLVIPEGIIDEEKKSKWYREMFNRIN